MSDTDFSSQSWIFAGRREKAKGGLFYVWINHHGEEVSYGKVKGTVVGGRYDVMTNAEGSKVSGTPVYQGKSDDARTARWELEDRAAYTADQLRKREAKAKGEDHIGELTLSEVRDMLVTRFGMPRTALLAQVLRYIGA